MNNDFEAYFKRYLIKKKSLKSKCKSIIKLKDIACFDEPQDIGFNCSMEHASNLIDGGNSR